MPSNKELREYEEKYSELPNTLKERVLYLMKVLNFTNKDLTNLKSKILAHKRAKWNEVKLIIYFVPKATPRARYSGFTKKFYVSDAKNNSDIMKKFVKENMSEFQLITTNCKFYCDTYFPTPITSMSKVEVVLSELMLISQCSKPDWDNIGKTYSDMIQNHIILDDSSITEGRVRKFFSIKPRIEVTIKYMEKYDSNYNKRRIKSKKQYKDNIDRIEDVNSI